MSPDTKIDHIADVFRQSILDGEYGRSGRLPSLRMLAERYSTTHETMNKVVQLLQAEGLLYSEGRAGVFVSKPRTRIPGITARFDLYLKEHGLVPFEHNIEEPSIVPASIDVAKVFHIDEGSPVVRRIRLQGVIDGLREVPYRIAENFYSVSLAGDLLDDMRKDERMDVLLAIKANHNLFIEFVHEDVVSRLPTTSEQSVLKVVRNTPLLEVHRTNFAENHTTVIMFNHIIYVSSYFLLDYDYVTGVWSNKK